MGRPKNKPPSAAVCRRLIRVGCGIAKARCVNGLTKAEIARRCKVSPQAVHYWLRLLENGNPLPDGRLEQLRAAVGMPAKK